MEFPSTGTACTKCAVLYQNLNAVLVLTVSQMLPAFQYVKYIYHIL